MVEVISPLRCSSETPLPGPAPGGSTHTTDWWLSLQRINQSVRQQLSNKIPHEETGNAPDDILALHGTDERARSDGADCQAVRPS